MTNNTTNMPSVFKKNSFEKFASGLRVTAWLWIVVATAVLAPQVDLPRLLALELSTFAALELLGGAALILGPGSFGLALSFVIERVSYLTSDLNLF